MFPSHDPTDNEEVEIVRAVAERVACMRGERLPVMADSWSLEVCEAFLDRCRFSMEAFYVKD